VSELPRWEHTPIWHVVLPWQRPPLMANDTGQLRMQMGERAATRDDTATVARSLKLQPITIPVVAVLTWYTASRRTTDPDNIAPTLKRCLDGLRLAGVLADDHADPAPAAGPRVILSLYDGRALALPHIAPAPSATLATAYGYS
jgi:hypothetical protein